MISKLSIDYSNNFRLLELAIGQGNIIKHIFSEFLDYHKGKDANDLRRMIENTFFGFDKDYESIDICIDKLNDIAYKRAGLTEIKWNIRCINIFEQNEIDNLGSFDYIISNPPYISRKNMTDVAQVNWLHENSLFCSKFNIDLYYFFFEVGIMHWNRNGRIVFITPNSFLRAKSAKKMREFLEKNRILFEIIDFADNLLFENASTYSAITVLEHNHNQYSHFKGEYDRRKNVIQLDFVGKYVDFSKFIPTFSFSGDTKALEEICYISNGIATLNDTAFIIKSGEITRIDSNNIVFQKNSREFSLQTSHVKSGIRISNSKQINYVVFPYDNSDYSSLDSEEERYHELFGYLKLILPMDYQKKYGLYFGRRQGLKFHDSKKIVIPKVANLKNDFYIDCTSSLVIAGIYLSMKQPYEGALGSVCDYLNSAKVKDFLRSTSKNYGSGYVSISTDDLRRILVPTILLNV